jgi:hypothetical protein
MQRPDQSRNEALEYADEVFFETRKESTVIATPSSLISANGTVPQSRAGSDTPTVTNGRSKPNVPSSLTELEVQGRNTLPLPLGDDHLIHFHPTRSNFSLNTTCLPQAPQ